MAESVHASISRPSDFRTLFYVGICCTLTGVYPAYIAGILASHCIKERFHICHLYIAKCKSAILGPLLVGLIWTLKQNRLFEPISQYGLYISNCICAVMYTDTSVFYLICTIVMCVTRLCFILLCCGNDYFLFFTTTGEFMSRPYVYMLRHVLYRRSRVMRIILVFRYIFLCT